MYYVEESDAKAIICCERNLDIVKKVTAEVKGVQVS